MSTIRRMGGGLVVVALILFTYLLFTGQYQLTRENLPIDNQHHQTAVLQVAIEADMLGKHYTSVGTFLGDFRAVLKGAQAQLNSQAEEGGLPENVSEWDYKIGDWKVKEYLSAVSRSSLQGPVKEAPLRWLLLTIGLAALGGLFMSIPAFFSLPGIKHDGIYHSAMKRGLTYKVRSLFLGLTIAGALWYGIIYMSGQWYHSLHTLLILCAIVYLVYVRGGKWKLAPARSSSPSAVAWLGIFTGTYLIGFYIVLYWFPQYISPWIEIVDPVSRSISGNPASQWFLYGFLYTIVMLVMGVRMIAKYRHNRYQIIRTISVIFFQTAFAFLLPEILTRLNQPYFDFKNIWPLNYTFFFDYNLDSLVNGGGLGLFMLVWGIVLIVVAVPVLTYFYGKRWYCSWVCGCGGLAETLGDPFRQLSDKSLKAWRVERWMIHAVLVFAVVMTAAVLYTYFSGSSHLLFISSDSLRTWYGFLIGSSFAGVVGTGFYPLMGNRMWCRFGCPLAAYLGLVQKFKSRFRITVNGGQCISCGNCSTYCEMGIDVRHYAQRGQDVVRSSCVGCGVCAAVCPRGVLRLENGSIDIDTRAEQLRTVHVRSEEVGILS